MHVTKWKKSVWKVYILYDSKYMMFWKRQNDGDRKNISGCQGLGWVGEKWKVKHREFLRQWKSSIKDYNYDYMCLCKSIEYTAPRENPKVNYRLRVVIMCQYRFIDCNKRTTLAGDVNKSESYACVGARAIQKILYLLLSFAMNLKLLSNVF